ncbi:MAG: Rne/Rng family ribonuclease [Desulfobulbaceae bacterium]|nr:Rne/Rng family ribonuclease [Desulfobulbaceae bacterium]
MNEDQNNSAEKPENTKKPEKTKETTAKPKNQKKTAKTTQSRPKKAAKSPAKPRTKKNPKSAKTDETATAEVKTESSTETKKTAVRKKRPPRSRAKSKSGQAKKSASSETVCKLLINTDEPEECRIALVENGKVEGFHVETVLGEKSKGNVYKGRISAVEPNLQAAFVDMGTERNGFLAFSDIHPEYYCKEVAPDTHWKRLNIQDVIKKGQEVLVEVVKETTGMKGASVTTFLSLPGRYLVLMPGSDSHGVSRQITDEPRRAKLREIVNSVKLGEGIGYIIRTASRDVTKIALTKDIRYLLNLWKEIKEQGQKQPAPSLVYKEQNVIARFLRDHFTDEITEILVDNKEAFDQVNHFLNLLPARQRKTNVKLHRGAKPIFNQYQVEEQIEQMYQPMVPLPSGGSIVINPTEALVAIDVNSGRTAKDKNFEETVFLANMEAAEELVRQLRLRDLGGLIVVDFIDMREARHNREVEKKVKACLKRDKAKSATSRISKFGLMQISRQRLGPPIQKGNYIICEHCQGQGMIRSVETTALALLRRIQTGVTKKNVNKVDCRFPLKTAQYILNQKRTDIVNLEQKYKVEILIKADPDMTPAQSSIEFGTQRETKK